MYEASTGSLFLIFLVYNTEGFYGKRTSKSPIKRSLPKKR